MVTITGGDKLQAVLDKVAASLTTAASVEIGYPAGGTHTDKDGNTASLPLIAALNEFGRPDMASLHALSCGTRSRSTVPNGRTRWLRR